MPENPLLPDGELRSLYTYLKQAVAVEQKAARASSKPHRPGSQAALHTACTLQLKAGDLLAAPSAVAAPNSAASVPGFPAALTAKGAPLLLAAAAVAAGLRAAHAEGLVLCMLTAGGAQLEWESALRWAQTERLPLVVVCADAAGFGPSPAPVATSGKTDWNWPNVRKQTNLLQFPVLTVDGEDAVAVYRCMQESALRARSGGGPAMLWATLPSPRELRTPRPPAQQPLGRLRQYLRSRKIALSA